jgi:hypothetical protein
MEMKKEENNVYMCMSCGNCKRKDGENGISFTFACSHGEFIIDAPFAAKIEIVGCRSWKPSDENYCEPYVITIDGKHKEIKIGKLGGIFIDLEISEFSDICNAFEEDEFGHVIDACKDACGH